MVADRWGWESLVSERPATPRFGSGSRKAPINARTECGRRVGSGEMDADGDLGQMQPEGCDFHLDETGTVSLGANINQLAPCVIGADHLFRPKAFRLGFPRVCA